MLLDEFFNILDSEFLQFGAETIKIDTQLAFSKALAGFLFLGDALLARFRHFSRSFARHHHDAVGIAHDYVARIHQIAPAHTTGTFTDPAARLHCALRGNGLGPNRKLHRR